MKRLHLAALLLGLTWLAACGDNGDDTNTRTEYCGDGITQEGEECDDGNKVDTDSCTSACKLPRCGDGIIQPGEECDDGNTVNDDYCTNLCKAPRCGDGIVQAGELCDDGNSVETDGCTKSCTLATCGDGAKQEGEECDDGNDVETDGCTSRCLLPVCGNGIVQEGEECDDGNSVDTDGCTNACTLPGCGDGTVQPGEECDDGNEVSGDGCSANCRSECGDGLLQSGEACDDGNRVAGDGCSANCRLETGVCADTIVDLTAKLSGNTFTYEGTNKGETSLLDASCGCGRNPTSAHSLYVRQASHLVLTLESATADLVLSVRTGDCTMRSAESGCIDDTGWGTEELELTVPAQTQLWILVHGCDEMGAYTLAGTLFSTVESEAACDSSEGLYCSPGFECLSDGTNDTCQPAYCGDGRVSPGEYCDDPTDIYCMALGCKESRCGDGFADYNNGEECDDGNERNDDSCTTACKLKVCGDGILQRGEECDDGNRVAGDGCSSACIDEAGLCSPAKVTDLTAELSAGMAFYEGTLGQAPNLIEISCWYRDNPKGDAAVTFLTTAPAYLALSSIASYDSAVSIREGSCFTDAKELGCSSNNPIEPVLLPASSRIWIVMHGDANSSYDARFQFAAQLIPVLANGTACGETTPGFCGEGLLCADGKCAPPACGDGIVSGDEECDPKSDPHCLPTCQRPRICGDGSVDAGEECEPKDNPFCLSTCEYASRCGDGMVSDDEECDDGNNSNTDTCSITCRTLSDTPVCGDGARQGAETCDDGNATDGDGCSSSCTLEVDTETCSGGPIIDLASHLIDSKFVVTGSTFGAPDLVAPNCAGGGNGAPDAIYGLFATTASKLTIDTTGLATNYDTSLSIRTGSCYTSGRSTELECDDDGGDGRTSKIIHSIPANTQLWIVVSGYSINKGNFTLNGWLHAELGDACNDEGGPSCGPDALCLEGLCKGPECGDGILSPGEECEPGEDDPTCGSDCYYPSCGDGVVDEGEECDDGTPGPVNDGCVACKLGCAHDSGAFAALPGNGQCLALFDEHLSFSEAEAQCVAKGGHLATIRNARDNIMSRFLANGRASWIGLTDSTAEGAFEWLSGETLGYTNWDPVEPNGFEEENCVEFLDNGLWNDLSCGLNRYYFCDLPL